MRAYFFVNSALSGIQKGIQVAHCVAELMRSIPCWDEDCPTYFRGKELPHAIREWSEKHKTTIVLEGGFHAALKEIDAFFIGDTMGRDDVNINPWISFSEDEETMNGMMTCVGIILPERIYEAAKAVKEDTAGFGISGPPGSEWYFAPGLNFKTNCDISEWNPYTCWEVELIKLLNSRPLAR